MKPENEYVPITKVIAMSTLSLFSDRAGFEDCEGMGDLEVYSILTYEVVECCGGWREGVMCDECGGDLEMDR